MSVHPKRKLRFGDSYKNEKYLAWIRVKGCLVCKSAPCDAHHVWCNRSSDYTVVGLCRNHHREYHDTSHDAFERKYHIDFEWEIIEMLSDYIKECL